MPQLIYEILKYLLETARRSESNPAAHAKASTLLEQLEAIKAEEIAAHAQSGRILEELQIEVPKTEARKPESTKA